MPSFIQRSFAGGELAPAMLGRADQGKYATGLATCRNMMVQRFGGVTNRPGTRFIRAAGNEAAPVRLMPFRFNDDQTYVIEIGKINHFTLVAEGGVTGEGLRSYLRFFRFGVPIIGAAHNGDWDSAITYVVGAFVRHDGRLFYGKANPNTDHEPTGEYSDLWWYPLPEDDTLEVPVPWAIGPGAPTVKFAQSGDTIVATATGHVPRLLVRRANNDWFVRQELPWRPAIDAPPIPVLTGGSGAGPTRYAVTAVQAETFIESLTSPVAEIEATPSVGNEITITWDSVSNALEYRVYKEAFGVLGLIGTVGHTGASTHFLSEDGIIPDTSLQAPTVRDVNVVLPGPSVAAFHQQRLILGGGGERVAGTMDPATLAPGKPERLTTSRIGDFYNFAIHNPLRADDSITINIAGRDVADIRNMVTIGQSLVVLTASAEYTITGDASGALTPFSVSVAAQSYSGSSHLQVLPVQETALFVQARGSIVRDLQYEFSTDGYRGRDLTVYSQHLFDGHKIMDWTYAQTPDSVVWAVRDDGLLLGMTYVREHDVWGWHRHDTAGQFESVVSVPEGGEDAVYVAVVRDNRRFIERFTSRQLFDIRDACFLDASGVFDGRNTTQVTMTITGGPPWTHGETFTLSASLNVFASGNVGQEVWLRIGGDILRCRITAFTNAFVVSVTIDRDVPEVFHDQGTTNWERAVTTLSGLDWLEGKAINIFADGYVHPERVVTSGSIELDAHYSVVQVGLGYQSDMMTLPLENVQGETYTDKPKRIRKTTVLVQQTRGLSIGPSFDRLREAKVRSDEHYDDPIRPITGTVEVQMNSSYDMTGQVAIRQDDPIPLTVLAVVPAGVVVTDR